MDEYEKILEMRKKIIAIATNSSRKVSAAKFESLIKLSITKHKPSRFEDVGKICLEIFFVLSPVSGIIFS